VYSPVNSLHFGAWPATCLTRNCSSRKTRHRSGWLALGQRSPTWCPRAPGRPRACSDNSINMFSVLTLMSTLIFIDNIIEDKLINFLFRKCVYQTGSPSHESVPRSSSQFQKRLVTLLWGNRFKFGLTLQEVLNANMHHATLNAQTRSSTRTKSSFVLHLSRTRVNR